MQKVFVRKLGAINARIGSLQRTHIHSAQMFWQGSVKARQRLVISEGSPYRNLTLGKELVCRISAQPIMVPHPLSMNLVLLLGVGISREAHPVRQNEIKHRRWDTKIITAAHEFGIIPRSNLRNHLFLTTMSTKRGNPSVATP
jgi:hypothetical protein